MAPNPSSNLQDLLLEHATHGDDSRITAVALSMIVISSILVFLRLMARSVQRGTLGLDDWIIVVSQALVLLLLATSIILSHKGVGQHLPITLKSMEEIESIRKWIFVKKFSYISSMASIRLSILALYIRLFPTRFTIRYGRFLAIITILWLIVASLLCLLQCKPISSNWEMKNDGICSAVREHFLSMTTTNIILDIFTLCLPIKEIKGLQMPLWKKIAICGIFIAGGFVTLVSIIRVSLLTRVFDSSFNTTFSPMVTMQEDSTPDFLIPALIWTDVEVGVGIMCACLPVLRPIIRLVARPFIAIKIHDSPTLRNFRIKNKIKVPRATDSVRDLVPQQQEIPTKPPSLILRKDKTEHNTTVYTGDGTSSTDIALNMISVKKDFRWEEEHRSRQ
ncbi:hypothetical protein F4776DRAFT_424658 [Hypoxylon sp. NC0597]|nr:hypothetical protein F4776DRAFT_424658 [Hypoxylon sp. NC0597]